MLTALTALAAAACGSGEDAPPEPLWAHTFGAAQGDEARDLALAPDGGYVVVGRFDEAAAAAAGSAGDLSVVVRLDRFGALSWTLAVPGSGAAVGVSPDGRVTVVGQLEMADGQLDAWVQKVSSKGESLGAQTYGGPDDDAATAVLSFEDGDLVAGTTTYTGGSSAWLRRLSEFGGIDWQRGFAGADSTRAAAVAAIASGGFAVAGSARAVESATSDLWVASVDDAGLVRWESRQGGEAGDEASDVAALYSGGIVVVGVSGEDGWVLRLSAEGDVEWERRFAGHPAALAALPGGDLAVAGETAGLEEPGKHAWAMRLDGQGEVLWERTFGVKAGSGAINALVALDDGGLAAAGFKTGGDAAKPAGWVFRLGPEGSDCLATGACAGKDLPE